MRYKETDKGVRQIAEELNVANILEGSVRRAGGQVRITGQLIDASADRQLWSDSYTHELADVFAVQSEVANRIVDALRVEISPSQRETLARPPTESATAYDYYLKGMQYYKRYRDDDNELAIELFQRALEDDPDFSLAHAGLADAYAQRWQRFGGDRQAAHELSLREAEQAIALDSALAESTQGAGQRLLHRGHGAGVVRGDAQGGRAQTELPGRAGQHRSLRGSSSAVGRGASSVQASGTTGSAGFPDCGLGRVPAVSRRSSRFRSALVRSRPRARARQHLEPVDAEALSQLYEGKSEAALDITERILEIAPEDSAGLRLAATAHWQNGDFAEAKRYAARAPGEGADFLGHPAAHIAWSEGRREAARELLQPRLTWLERASDLGLTDYLKIAETFVILDDEDEAYRYLEKALDEGLARDGQLRYYPSFAGMQDQERFRRILERVDERIAQQRRQIEEG